MALTFIDSFDHYDDAQILNKWSSITNDPAIGAVGRFGNGLSATGNSRYFFKVLPALTTYVAGFAVKFDGVTAGDGGCFAFTDGATIQVDIRINSSANLRVTRNGTTLGSPGTTILTAGVWYYLEFKALIHGSTGTVQLKINGTDEINLTGQNTQASGAAQITGIRLGTVITSVGTPYSFDDFYLLDTTGSAPTNTFLGDVRVEALYPNGNGNSSQWVGSDSNSTDNYLLVDDPSVPDDDTTYVESSTVSNKDTYAMTNLTPGTGTVYGVQAIPWARKTDAGTRSIVSVARLSGTETDSADKSLSTSYNYYPDIREAKPGGGVWTVTDVNSAEFGVKVSA